MPCHAMSQCSPPRDQTELDPPWPFLFSKPVDARTWLWIFYMLSRFKSAQDFVFLDSLNSKAHNVILMSSRDRHIEFVTDLGWSTPDLPLPNLALPSAHEKKQAKKPAQKNDKSCPPNLARGSRKGAKVTLVSASSP